MKPISLLACVLFTCVQGQARAEDTAAKPPGYDLFVEKCAMCHRDIGMGTRKIAENYNIEPKDAWLENRPALPAQFVEYVVRNGKGIMFSISRAEVSDAQLKEIAQYLETVTMK